MRIAIAKPRRGAGGGTTMALALAEGLRSRGHDVTILCHPRARIDRLARARGFEVDAVLAGRDLRALSRLRSWIALRRRHPDVVLNFMAEPTDMDFCVPSALRLEMPVVARRALAGPLQLSAAQRRLFAAVGWVAVSRAIARELRDAVPGLRTPPTIIYNGTDIDHFAGAEPAALGLPPDAIAIGFIGRLHREKGIRELAVAWPAIAAALPRAHLVIVGEGPHEAEFRALLGRAPRVRWLGFRHDVAPILRALDLLALPTHREGFPNIIVEALAAGRAIVTTTVDGPNEAVRDTVTGRLVPPADSAALRDAVIALAGDAELRARLGRAAAQDARVRFDRARMIAAYEDVLVGAAAQQARA
ncbi:MAG: glycosyltransferase family 4 protein [Longimicrobiales bacterium]